MNAPPRLDLKVGFNCNNRCLFCVQGDKRDHVDDRTPEDIRSILEEHASTMSGVVFTGGEPTLRDDLVEHVRWAKELGFQRIQVQTNGRRVSYLPYMRALVEAGMSEISPALHGATPEVHDALTRAPRSFKQVIRGIANARLVGVPVLTNTVVTKHNFKDLPRIATLLLRLGVRHMQFAFVHPAGTAETLFEDVVPTFDEAVPYMKRAVDIAHADHARAFTEAVPYCLMKGYEHAVAEQRIPDTLVVDGRLTIEDYTSYRWQHGKTQGPPCETCTWKDACEGPWREYPRERGWHEISPRTDPPPTHLAGARPAARAGANPAVTEAP